MNKLLVIAGKFNKVNNIIDIQEFGRGNINNTFLVTTDSELNNNFILQRINKSVFPQPNLVMDNICIVTDRIRGKLKDFNQDLAWQVPTVLLTEENNNYWLDEEGEFWRSLSFIENAESFDTIQNQKQAEEIGFALGMFHYLISDLPIESLADTLPGFHITPRYLKKYHRVLANTKIKSNSEVNYCFTFIEERLSLANILEDAKQKGILNLRPIHGDPKINNIMFDRNTKKAVSIIDLDTVKPGLIHYDIGDCLRSSCNVLGEETKNWEDVYFDLDLAKVILDGYIDVARNFLTRSDRQYIFDSVRLIAFELGLRFFTDYLEGNIYFKTEYSEHNLMRALVQFKLTESIEGFNLSPLSYS